MDKFHLAQKEKTMGDTAVDGLIAGLLAGTLMMLALMAGGLVTGTAPLVMLGYFDPARNGSWQTGLPAHLAVAAVYGVIFALLWRLAALLPSSLRRGWLLGAAYGVVLFGLARGIMGTAVVMPLQQIAGWNLALGHLVYGAVLGIQLHRGDSNPLL